jgi:chlorosome envelope protein H
MASDELNKPATVKPAPKDSPDSNVGNGDMAHLIGNMGILIDSTIASVQDMISKVSSTTGQLIDGVNSTINSEPVKEIIHNVNSVSGQLIEGVNSVSGQLIEGVTATLKSEQVQSSVQELGKLWTSLLENLNSTVSSDQVKSLFENVSSGLGQLAGNVFSPGGMNISMSDDKHKKEVKQIPFCQKPSAPAENPVAAPIPSAAKPEEKPKQANTPLKP